MKYAFTLKHTRRDMRNCTPSDYTYVYTRWGTHGCAVQKVYYEPDKQGVCHAHGVVDVPKNLYRKKITSIPGMHVKLVECYDEKSWLAYARKLCPLTRPCIHDDQCLMDRLTKPLFVVPGQDIEK